MEISIKDYILTSNIETSTSVSKKNKTQYTYSVVVKNDSDIVIRKQSSRAYKDFVILFSQGLVYIKDNNDAVTNIINNKEHSRLIRNFFKEMNFSDIDWSGVEWIELNKISSVDDVISFIDLYVDNYDYNVDLYKNKIYFYNTSPTKEFIALFKENKKLARILYYKTVILINNSEYLSMYQPRFALEEVNNIAEYILFFYQYGDYNIAYKALENIYRNNILCTSRHYATKQILKDIYDLVGYANMKRLVEYLTEDLLEQGIYYISYDILNKYRDYLNMCKTLYGEIDEKYPKYLKVAHDIVVMKYNGYQYVLKKDFSKIEDDIYRKLKNYQNERYIIIMPNSANDLLQEGRQLNHCVGSYTDSVIRHVSYIFFLRQKSAPDKSYYTIEVRKNDIDDEYDLTLTQCRGYNNMQLDDIEVIKFLQGWCKKFNIKYSV